MAEPDEIAVDVHPEMKALAWFLRGVQSVPTTDDRAVRCAGQLEDVLGVLAGWFEGPGPKNIPIRIDPLHKCAVTHAAPDEQQVIGGAVNHQRTLIAPGLPKGLEIGLAVNIRAQRKDTAQDQMRPPAHVGKIGLTNSGCPVSSLRGSHAQPRDAEVITSRTMDGNPVARSARGRSVMIRSRMALGPRGAACDIASRIVRSSTSGSRRWTM